MPVSARFEDGKFFVKQNGRLFATPLFVVLLVVETTALILRPTRFPPF
jgi:tellurite resistance protein TerC